MTCFVELDLDNYQMFLTGLRILFLISSNWTSLSDSLPLKLYTSTINSTKVMQNSSFFKSIAMLSAYLRRNLCRSYYSPRF